MVSLSFAEGPQTTPKCPEPKRAQDLPQYPTGEREGDVNAWWQPESRATSVIGYIRMVMGKAERRDRIKQESRKRSIRTHPIQNGIGNKRLSQYLDYLIFMISICILYFQCDSSTNRHLTAVKSWQNRILISELNITKKGISNFYS